jgi:hypothetical protein
MRAARLLRVVAIACGLTVAVASPSAAGDWLITPFIGTTFAADSNLVPLINGAGEKKTTIGGSGGFLTDGIIGVEANASYSFGFFNPGTDTFATAASAPVRTHTALGTLMGDVIFAVPVSITHESLRPYAVAGAGIMHATVEDIISFQSVQRNLAAMDVGGGVIGFVSRRAGFRFDVRRFNSLTHEPSAIPFFGGSRLSFWRLSAGVVLRLGDR